jgi:hypothetical protein
LREREWVPRKRSTTAHCQTTTHLLTYDVLQRVLVLHPLRAHGGGRLGGQRLHGGVQRLWVRGTPRAQKLFRGAPSLLQRVVPWRRTRTGQPPRREGWAVTTSHSCTTRCPRSAGSSTLNWGSSGSHEPRNTRLVNGHRTGEHRQRPRRRAESAPGGGAGFQRAHEHGTVTHSKRRRSAFGGLRWVLEPQWSS